MIGGPSSASRWGLLLRIEEDEEDGGVVVLVGGATEEMELVKPGSSWVEGGAVYRELSKRPPNSMSWLLMSCSISEHQGEIKVIITFIHQSNFVKKSLVFVAKCGF